MKASFASLQHPCPSLCTTSLDYLLTVSLSCKPEGTRNLEFLYPQCYVLCQIHGSHCRIPPIILLSLVLSAGDTKLNKPDKVPAFMKLIFVCLFAFCAEPQELVF